ncbi:hypothetical protein [Mycobacterium sp. NPDC050041]|uniref:hypothetical protein n=1 Tax=Mycobacterium sp. NPDC050041 TaxID=3364293 RepID=UPI003C2E93DC
MAAIQEFHRNLGTGLLGRRIERSPLRFARHRWVRWPGPGLDVAAPRPRADVSAWANERARHPLDPECGPGGWHLGVLPLVEGGAAVSLVVSHSLADGLGICLAVADAVEGRVRDLGYPPPHARVRRKAVGEDARLTAREVPEMARAVAAAVRAGRANGAGLKSSVAAAPPAPRRSGGRGDDVVDVPTVTVFVDQHEWDSRAAQLGGTSNSLFSGVACRLGVRLGRVRPDRAVTLSFPVSERTEGDTRANALTSAVVSVDPSGAAQHLGTVRAAIKAALVDLAATPNELLGPLPLTPLVPRRLARRLAGVALGNADLPIGCSNMGEMEPAVNRPDGTDADFMSVRLVEPGITRRTLDAMGGQLFLASGRAAGRVFLAVVAYSSGRQNSEEILRDTVLETLAEFELTAVVQ